MLASEDYLAAVNVPTNVRRDNKTSRVSPSFGSTAGLVSAGPSRQNDCSRCCAKLHLRRRHQPHSADLRQVSMS